MRVLLLGVLSVGLFAAGFVTHREGLHDYVQPALAWAMRDTGGCGLLQAYSAVLTGPFDEAFEQLRRSRKLIEKTTDGLESWQTAQGVFWAPTGIGLPMVFVLAEQVVRIYGDGQHRVQPGEVVLDAGANIGAFTREALNAGAKLVIAIEPVPANVESLRRTFQTEIQEGRVRIVAKGVWNKEDILEMNIFDSSVLDSFVMSDRPESRTPSRRVLLPLTTIDLIVQELQLPRVDFIKMDIEGAERQALEGARQTITHFRPRMSIATENLPDDYEVVPQVIAGMDAGYSWMCGPCAIKGPFTIRPTVLYFRQR